MMFGSVKPSPVAPLIMHTITGSVSIHSPTDCALKPMDSPTD